MTNLGEWERKFPAKLPSTVCLENINLENISNLIFSRKWDLFYTSSCEVPPTASHLYKSTHLI